MDEFIKTIGNVAFLIAVSVPVYILIRIEGKLEKLTDSINMLSNVINNFRK